MSYYQQHKTEISVKRRKYYQQNRSQILGLRRRTYAALSPIQRQQRQVKGKSAGLQTLYHLSMAQYHAMLVTQDHKCASCGKPFGSDRENVPCVDHDHKCCAGARSCGRCVRALLCRWCNRLIGIIEKNPFLIDYLKQGASK